MHHVDKSLEQDLLPDMGESLQHLEVGINIKNINMIITLMK